jgi:hypothetical protein
MSFPNITMFLFPSLDFLLCVRVNMLKDVIYVFPFLETAFYKQSVSIAALALSEKPN